MPAANFNIVNKTCSKLKRRCTFSAWSRQDSSSTRLQHCCQACDCHISSTLPDITDVMTFTLQPKHMQCKQAVDMLDRQYVVNHHRMTLSTVNLLLLLKLNNMAPVLHHARTKTNNCPLSCCVSKHICTEHKLVFTRCLSNHIHNG